MSKVLVTGAGGFIGSHLVQHLVNVGHEVTALVRYNGRSEMGHLKDLAPDTREQLCVRFGDVTDQDYVRRIVAGSDIVCHLAALIGIPYSYDAPASYVETNIRGTLNVLEACRAANVSRVIVTSTSEVYGTARYTPIDENHPLQGQSPYSASKIGADKIAESYFRTFDVPVVTLRPFNTYGPRQSARAVIPTILIQALSGSKVIRLGNLSPKRDLTYVEDTARAFVLATSVAGLEGEVIHCGQGEAISVRDLAQCCLDILGSDAEIVSEEERERPGNSEVELLLCDRTKAEGRLGWQPETSLRDGLRKVAAYLDAHRDEYHPGVYMR